MLLDIQNFAKNQREHQDLLNKEVALTHKQLIKSIEDVPTTEFDKFLNPMLKKEIEYYYKRVEYGKRQEFLEIGLTPEEILKIYYIVNDKSTVNAYRDARAKAENCCYRIDIANKIIIDKLTKRLTEYLESADKSYIIQTRDQINFDDQYRLQMVVKYPTIKLP